MTLIPPFFLNCVVCFGSETRPGQKVWTASGFFYGYPVENESDKIWVYLVTNRHVLEGREKLYVRFNTVGTSPAREYELTMTDTKGNALWFAHPDPNIDVAVLQVNPNTLNKEGIEFAVFEEDRHALTMKKALEEEVSEGDLVYILGFPMELIGGDRNFVIVRQGSIARISDALAGKSREFLVDAFVFPGNSGGPVVTKPEAIAIEGTKALRAAYLIGLVKGYIPYTDMAVSLQTGKPRITFEENSGLTSVIPVDFVIEAIQADRARKKQQQPQPVTSGAAEPSA